MVRKETTLLLHGDWRGWIRKLIPSFIIAKPQQQKFRKNGLYGFVC